MLRALKDFASCVGTYFSVLSYGKFAKNEYLRSAIQNGIDVRFGDIFLPIGKECFCSPQIPGTAHILRAVILNAFTFHFNNPF